jgi:hypothetical protein
MDDKDLPKEEAPKKEPKPAPRPPKADTTGPTVRELDNGGKLIQR